MEARIAVLVSGSGTNLQALLDDPVVRPHITLVLSDRPDVFSLDRARDAGVESAVIEPDGFADRSDFDLAVLALLEDRRIDTLVSAGYMRLLGKPVLDVYGGRWLNVHPALLPSFPGMHGVRDALAYGVKVTGVSVFLVDEGVDHGPDRRAGGGRRAARRRLGLARGPDPRGRAPATSRSGPRADRGPARGGRPARARPGGGR